MRSCAGTSVIEWEAARFRERRAELKLGPLVIHDNYLINLACPERMMRARSIQTFHDELVRAVALGADFLVAHPGCALTNPVAQGIEDIADGLRQAARGIKFGNLRILIENTSGMGSAVGARFEEIREILDRTRDLPMGVCLDTAHTFQAGHQITTEAGLSRTIESLQQTVGLQNIYVLHVNDSKTALGSRLDRHEHIGLGKIGSAALGMLLNHPRLGPGPQGLAGRAFILETPIDKPGDDRRNVRALWRLVGLQAKQAPKAENGFSMLRAKRKVLAAPVQPEKKRQAPKRTGGVKAAGENAVRGRRRVKAQP